MEIQSAVHLKKQHIILINKTYWIEINFPAKNQGNDNNLDVEYVIIIVIAIVVLVAVNIVVCFVIYRERQRKWVQPIKHENFN